MIGQKIIKRCSNLRHELQTGQAIQHSSLKNRVQDVDRGNRCGGQSQKDRCRGVTCRAKSSDATCRDLVNEPRQNSGSQEGSSSITFLGANEFEMHVDSPKDTYILDAGLDGGLELPYTCRGGICGACVGRVVEGSVDMSDIADVSFTLSEDELEQGLTLLCMARPVSDVVKVETQSDWGYSLGSGKWNGATGEIAGKKVQPLNPWGSDS